MIPLYERTDTCPVCKRADVRVGTRFLQTDDGDDVNFESCEPCYLVEKTQPYDTD